MQKETNHNTITIPRTLDLESRHKVDQKIHELNKEFGHGQYGEVLAATAHMYPSDLLGDTEFIFDHGSDDIAGGMTSEKKPRPMVYMGMKGDLSPAVR